MNDPTPDPISPWPSPPPQSESPLSGPSPGRADHGLRYWLRRLLVCNPFFLVSAALLLYALARLSSDATLFAEETQNLLFNFLALQAYSLLLVFTALRLARRSIWYDSALLGVLEHGLVLVPFLLLSQAVFIAPVLGWLLIALAGAAAAGRCLWVRRRYPEFNLPARAICLGGAVLGLNMLAPVVARQIVDRTSVEDWATPHRMIWGIVLPALVLGGNLLPVPRGYGGRAPERSWLPILIYGLWVAGTGVHAWSLGYVCKQPFTGMLLVPTGWAIAWTLYARARDFVCAPSLRFRTVLLALTFLVPWVSLERPSVVAALLGLNLALYATPALRRGEPIRSIARELRIASAVGLAILVPAGWLQPLLVPLHLTRTHWVLFLLGAQLIRCCWQLPYPAIGLGSAILLGIGIASSAPVAFSGNLALQSAFAWLLVHSLRWNSTPGGGENSGTGLRYGAAAAWIAHAFLCTWDAPWHQGVSVSSIALLVIAAWWVVLGRRHPRPLSWVAGAACLPLVAFPTNALVAHSSAGLLALVLSFLLFGIGTGAAYLRSHWEARKSRSESPDV